MDWDKFEVYFKEFCKPIRNYKCGFCGFEGHNKKTCEIMELKKQAMKEVIK